MLARMANDDTDGTRGGLSSQCSLITSGSAPLGGPLSILLPPSAGRKRGRSATDYDTAKPRLPSLSTSCFPGFSLPKTLPPPYPTLLPFASCKPRLPPLPSLPHLTDDVYRMDPSCPGTRRRPRTVSSNDSSQSPIPSCAGLSHHRRSPSQDTTYGRPLTPHSRRSSQASVHTNLSFAEDCRTICSSAPTLVKTETGTTSFAPHASRGSGKAPAVATMQASAMNKARRVRTGCLTCRERHLKCDESLPDCLNCRKGKRECKRGLRLNFIDIQVKAIPFVLPVSEWNVSFLDESRLIASDYVGGSGRYPRIEDVPAIPVPKVDAASVTVKRRRLSKVVKTRQSTPPIVLTRERVKSVPVAEIGINEHGDFGLVPGKESAHPSPFSDTLSISSSMAPQESGSPAKCGAGPRYDAMPDALLTPPSEKASMPQCETEFGIDVEVEADADRDGAYEKDYLNSADEIVYMQVFVEEVGVWMDALDKHEHFGRVLPFLALRSPMLLNAFFACGARQLALSARGGQDNDEDKALYYYDTATTQLLRSLQNPDRNLAECATTAVVLHVYEAMSEKSHGRMSHTVGARALVRECDWNARSEGMGAACFWLNIGMEVLECLSCDWPTAWDPDQWGLDLSFVNELVSCHDGESGTSQPHGRATAAVVSDYDEELWMQRIFYVLAKVANFRANVASVSPRQTPPHDEQMRLHSRFAEWKRLKDLCDGWNHCCPRSMKPFSYLYPSQNTASTSVFPNVWLFKRAAVIGRLFYHTAMILLHQMNPLRAPDSLENQKAQTQHARQVCGIVAHAKNGGVATMAMRSLAIAAAVLQDEREQDEAVVLLQRSTATTGWRAGRVVQELYAAWGRDRQHRNLPCSFDPFGPFGHEHGKGPESGHLDGPVAQRVQPRTNPLLRADFSLPDRPYKAFYRPPSETTLFNTRAF